MRALILGLSFILVEGFQFPPGVTLCHRSDPDFVKCVGTNLGRGLASFRNGSKYFGLPTLEPFLVEEMTLKHDPTASVAIQQIYRNVSFSGLINSNTEEGFMLDLDEKCGWVMHVKTPVIRMVGYYELKGKILMFPLNGHGNCNITMINMLNIHTMTCEKYTSNGKTYLKVTNYTMNMSLDSIAFDFQNIFPENEQIGHEIMKTINENSMIIFKEAKGSFEDILSSVHWTMTNKVFDKVPLIEIFLD